MWKKAVKFRVQVYKVTDTFPRDEKFGLTSQIRRASVSIAANIAEGAGRKSKKEFSNFLSISQGSASEVETELIIAFQLGYFCDKVFQELTGDLDEIGRMVTGLRRYCDSQNAR